MSENITNEFSFVLKPSKFGVGVFAAHNIIKGTYLRLFGNEKMDGEIKLENQVRVFNYSDVPEIFKNYCVSRGDKLACPQDFGCMPVGWYLNHSDNPNAFHKDYHYYALRDINEGEEIMIDYNVLEEPESEKENYYKK
jgi:SET domain-containing protein